MGMNKTCSALARPALALLLTALCLPAQASAEPAQEVDLAARDQSIIGQPARIAPIPIEQMSPEARAEAEAFRKKHGSLSGNAVKPGDVPPVLATMLRHPLLWRAHAAMATEIFQGALPARDREIVVLAVGWLWKAPVEWGEHVSIGKLAGLTDAEIERVKLGSAAQGWSVRDRALIAAVEELHRDAMITDATWSVLAENYTEKQLIELPMLVGHYTTVAFYQNALRLPPRPGSGGLAPR